MLLSAFLCSETAEGFSLIPLSLLAWAATASAECAWVLWYGSHLGSIEMESLKPLPLLSRYYRPARAEGEVSDTDAHLWHPGSASTASCVMLQTRWSAEQWAVVRQFRRAVCVTEPGPTRAGSASSWRDGQQRPLV